MNVVVGLTKLNDRTGSESYCLELVKTLRAARHEVEVFALYSNTQLEQELASLGATLCTFPRPLRLVPDRVVCMHPLATALLLQRVGRDVPALSVVHGVIPGEAPVRASRVDRWIAVSEFVADHLVAAEGLRREDVRVIPNGVDLARFSAPEETASPDPVRVLWASTYLPLRRRALLALCEAVLARSDARLTVVDDRLPEGLVSEDERISVVPKTAAVEELIRAHDVVAGLGPGRILLEALAMNRAALCLNVDGAAEYLNEANVARLEYYREAWGRPVTPLLAPGVVVANRNRRAVAEAHFDAEVNMRRVVHELEGLSRRSSSPLSYRLATLRRLPALAWNLALVPWLKVRLPVAPLRPLLRRAR